MKVHLDYNGCHLYSAGDKHFLVFKGILHLVTRQQLINTLIYFENKNPQEKVEYLITAIQRETFKKIQL
jgi:hypothetical protein